jgi:hypothetical protein
VNSGVYYACGREWASICTTLARHGRRTSLTAVSRTEAARARAQHVLVIVTPADASREAEPAAGERGVGVVHGPAGRIVWP